MTCTQSYHRGKTSNFPLNQFTIQLYSIFRVVGDGHHNLAFKRGFVRFKFYWRNSSVETFLQSLILSSSVTSGLLLFFSKGN